MKHAVERMQNANKEIFFNYQWAETGSGEGGHASSKNREYGISQYFRVSTSIRGVSRCQLLSF